MSAALETINSAHSVKRDEPEKLVRKERRRFWFRALRLIEFFFLFFGIPLFYVYRPFEFPVLVFLWFLTGVSCLYLWRHPKVRLAELFKWPLPRKALSKSL